MTFKPKKMFLHSFGNEKIEVLLIVYASVKVQTYQRKQLRRHFF